MKLYEELLSSSEVSKLLTLVNDLRAAGRRGQLPGKLFILCLECGTCQKTLIWTRKKVCECQTWKKTNQSHLFYVEQCVAVPVNDLKHPWVVASFYTSFCFDVLGLSGGGWVGLEMRKKFVSWQTWEKTNQSHLFYDSI